MTTRRKRDVSRVIGGWQRSLGFTCLGFDWYVRSNDRALLQYIGWLYDACAQGGPRGDQFVLNRHASATVASMDLSRNGTSVVRDVPPGLAVARVVWEINQAVVAEAGHRLLLHAAAVERKGAAVILPGPPGAGKSTLAGALVAAGLRYVTDEAVAIEPRNATIEPYPKPMALDRDTPLLANLNVSREPPFDSGVEQRLVPPQAFGLDVVAPAGTRARFILFVNYQPGSTTTLQPMGRAEAALALAEHSFNFRSRGPGTLELVANVVRACHCYRLGMNDLNEARRLVLGLLQEPETAGR